MPNIGVKWKTIGFGSQLKSYEKYPLALVHNWGVSILIEDSLILKSL